MELRGVTQRSHSNQPQISRALALDRHYFSNGISLANQVTNSRLRHHDIGFGVDMTKSPRQRDVDQSSIEKTVDTRAYKDLHLNGEQKCLSQIDLEESGYLGSLSAFDTGQQSKDELLDSESKLLREENELLDDWEFDTLNINSEDNNAKVRQESTPDRTIRNGFSHSFRDGTHFTNDMLCLSMSSSVCSDGSSIEGDLASEYTRLTTVLNNIDPKRLHNYLKRKLKQRDSVTVAALGSLLPKKKFKGETLHCVRCHKEYDPKHGDKTCELFHRKDDVMKISEDELGADFACERCGGVFRIDGKWKYKESVNKRHKCGACFSGIHTVSSDEVLYEPDGISKTCEDYGCIVFYV